MLGIISGFTELLRDDLPESSPQRRLAEQSASAVDKGTALTRQLLAFGRGRPDQAEVHDLGEVLAELEPMLHRTLGDHVRLRISAESSCRARIDRGRLEQVIVNLAANARDAMPGGGDLCIEVSHCLLHGRMVRLAVGDTGTGMDAAALERAFEPRCGSRRQAGHQCRPPRRRRTRPQHQRVIPAVLERMRRPRERRRTEMQTRFR